MNSNSRLVYSTSTSNVCAKCKKALKKCRCNESTAAALPNDGIIRLSRETKGRKGAGVTLITGFKETEAELKLKAKTLKALCGSGGTVKNGVIEIQGDHREKLKLHLEKNHTVKLSGG